MAGIIESSIKPKDELTTSGYEAEKIEIDPKTDLVQGQIQNVIDKNAPLMTSARTSAAQQANRRGLLNTSMAVGAGEKAVIDSALPIASQDAQTSFAAKGANAQATNQAFQYTADAQNQETLQQLRGEQATRLQQIENNNRMLVQSSQSAEGILRGSNAAITNILNDPDIPTGTKEALIARQTQLLENSLHVIGSISNLDLSGLLDFGGTEVARSPNVNTYSATPSSTASRTTANANQPSNTTEVTRLVNEYRGLVGVSGGAASARASEIKKRLLELGVTV